MALFSMLTAEPCLEQGKSYNITQVRVDRGRPAMACSDRAMIKLAMAALSIAATLPAAWGGTPLQTRPGKSQTWRD